MNIPTDVLHTCTKKTNKHDSLSLSCCLGHVWACSSLDNLVLQHFSRENNCRKRCFPPFIFTLRQHNWFHTACSLCIMTLPRPTACPSWDAQTLWPPRRWSFEKVSSWWWGRFRPWRCSSSRGSSQNSCPCPPALGAGSRSCRWRGLHGRSSNPSPRRAARRTLDHVRYLEHWGWQRGKTKSLESREWTLTI